jgi:hypothetical protein
MSSSVKMVLVSDWHPAHVIQKKSGNQSGHRWKDVLENHPLEDEKDGV